MMILERIRSWLSDRFGGETVDDGADSDADSEPSADDDEPSEPALDPDAATETRAAATDDAVDALRELRAPEADEEGTEMKASADDADQPTGDADSPADGTHPSADDSGFDDRS